MPKTKYVEIPGHIIHWDKDIRSAFVELSEHIRDVCELVNQKGYEARIIKDTEIYNSLKDWVSPE